MGGLVKGLLRLVLLGWIVAWVGGVIGAIAVKRRTVVQDDPAADDVVLVAIFGPLDFASTARRFRGGTVETWFGGGDIDLRDAVLDPAGADLALRAVFGGGQIIVPGSWRVTIAMRGLGGVGDGRSVDEDESAEGPELRIHATVLFGGYSVTTAEPETDDEPGHAPWRAVPIEVN
jgi:hypothetical protein